MPEMHLKQPGFTYITCGLFKKIKKEVKNLKKQDLQTAFTKMNLMKPVLSMAELIEIWGI